MADGNVTTGQAEDLLAEAARWRDEGHKVALATVVTTWGSSPRPVGTIMNKYQATAPSSLAK